MYLIHHETPKDQVVKVALVEEKSKAKTPLHALVPLFPDLGELKASMNQACNFFVQDVYAYKVDISPCYHQSIGDCPTFSVPSISIMANKVTYTGNLCHKETKSTINVGLGRGWY